jgi:myosin heavy subunit
LIGKKCSIMTCLEDQCFAPGGTDQKFVFSAYKNIKSEALKPGKVGHTQCDLYRIKVLIF